MQHCESRFGWLSTRPGYVTCKHDGDKVIVFERAGLVFAFNFHWDKSFTDYRIACETPGKYQPVLSSDDKDFGGHGRVAASAEHFSEPYQWQGREHSFLAYLPTRTALVFAR